MQTKQGNSQRRELTMSMRISRLSGRAIVLLLVMLIAGTSCSGDNVNVVAPGGGLPGGGPGDRSSVKLADDSLVLLVSERVTLQATVLDSSGALLNGSLQLSAVDPTIVSVDGSTRSVTALKEGRTMIVASAGGRADTATVIVQQTKSITASAVLDTLMSIGDTAVIRATGTYTDGSTIPPSSLRFRSVDTTIFAPAGGGRFVSRRTGPGYIIVTDGLGNGAVSVLVNVVQRIASVQLSFDSLGIVINSGRDVTVRITDARNVVIPGAAATFTIDNPAVVSAQPLGGVPRAGASLVGLKIGRSTIRTIAGGITDTAVVSVIPRPFTGRVRAGGPEGNTLSEGPGGIIVYRVAGLSTDAIVAFDSVTNAVRWRTTVSRCQSNEGCASLVDSAGNVYVPSDGGVTALRLADGALRWISGIGYVGHPLAEANGRLYAAVRNAPQNAATTTTVVALDTANGAALWQNPTPITDGFLAADATRNTVYIGGQGPLTAINASTGTTSWTLSYSSRYSGLIAPFAIGADGRLFIFSTLQLVAITPGGSIDWAVPLAYSAYNSPIIDAAGNVVVALPTSEILKFSSSGQLVWKAAIKGTFLSTPVIDKDGTIYLSNFAVYDPDETKFLPMSGGLVAVRDGVELWRQLEVGAEVGHLMISPSGLVWLYAGGIIGTVPTAGYPINAAWPMAMGNSGRSSAH